MRNYAFVVYGGFLLLCCCGGRVSAPSPLPNLEISPMSLSFGVVVLGMQSSAQAETLSNDGSSELALSSITISGSNAADFSLANSCPLVLGAGAACTVDITFTPSQLGPRTASIVVSDNGVGGIQTLSLTGDGGDSGPHATLSPTSLSFSDQNVGTTSAPQAITLSNYGTATFDIVSISASADFGETSTCNANLNPGASCTVNVTFAPGATGNFTGVLSVTDGAPDSPQTVSLSGICSPGHCQPEGAPCYGIHACCHGLTCVQEGDRAKCELVTGFVLDEP